MTVDVPHGEIIVGEDGGKDILVFSREAQGDATPPRIIRGLKTGLDEVRGVAVDPTRNVARSREFPFWNGPLPLLLLTRICADPMIHGRPLWELFWSLTSVFR